MGLFGNTAEDYIHASLKEIDTVIPAKNLKKVREWLVSINTRIKQGTIVVDKDIINKIKHLLKSIEKEEMHANAAIQKMENLMFEISKKQ